VGGNLGSALGPLLAAAIMVGRGQGNIAWCAAGGAGGDGAGGREPLVRQPPEECRARRRSGRPAAAARRVIQALAVLAMLVFSKYIYMASLSSYYTFFLIEKFHVPVGTAQMYLFLFLAAVAVGTSCRRPDRRPHRPQARDLGLDPGRGAVHAGPALCGPVLDRRAVRDDRLVMSSAFSAIVVFAQELVPGKVGMIAGIFFGLMFGVSGIGAAAMGHIADVSGIARCT
jgi:FSR family fosmidomycin resistance protein-like MFS transporter